MRWGALKNILAAAGAFFVAIIVIAIVLSVAGRGSGAPFGDKVAVVEIDGIITDPTEINREIRDYAERDDVKAVVIRINSPGGAVAPSQEIYNEVKRLRETKKVVASMGAVAASGGYYIAVAADRIVANPGTITGSIGVIIEFINVEELLNKLGVKGYVIKSGRFKDMGSPFKKMEPEEAALLQEVLSDVHRQFIGAVSKGRGIDAAEVEKIADGRIFSGAQALKLGLVDSLGDIADAIDEGARLAGMTGKPYVIYPEKPSGLWRLLLPDGVARIIRGFMPGMRVMYLLPDFTR
ncbi:MAG: signal peptide peptidase SppA [Deltaproteobacteria bacterium]|nr:signal peptide peptidase SppA [Deltaproteobacteria bacterium]